jgi:hypothetical protein
LDKLAPALLVEIRFLARLLLQVVAVAVGT